MASRLGLTKTLLAGAGCEPELLGGFDVADEPPPSSKVCPVEVTRAGDEPEVGLLAMGEPGKRSSSLRVTGNKPEGTRESKSEEKRFARMKSFERPSGSDRGTARCCPTSGVGVRNGFGVVAGTAAIGVEAKMFKISAARAGVSFSMFERSEASAREEDGMSESCEDGSSGGGGCVDVAASRRISCAWGHEIDAPRLLAMF